MTQDEIDDHLHKSWRDGLIELCKSYRFATDGYDVRNTWRDLIAHLDNQPASMGELTDSELRAGVTMQRNEIDRLKMSLRDWKLQALTAKDERDALLEMNGKQAQTITLLRDTLKTIEPYVRDKVVSGRKPLKPGIYTIHIGQTVRDALGDT